MPAQALDIVDQMGSGIVGQVAMRPRAAGPALVENDNAVVMGIEEPAMGRGRAGTRPAMQEDDRRPFRVAALFPVHGVAAIEIEHPGGKGFDGWVKIAAGG